MRYHQVYSARQDEYWILGHGADTQLTALCVRSIMTILLIPYDQPQRTRKERLGAVVPVLAFPFTIV
jgi:hypothetical protein